VEAFVMIDIKDEQKFTTISIPTPLAEKIKKRIEGTGFTSLSSYVTYVLREVISGIEEDGKEAFSKEDEERIKERLRSLGYLD
jgi:Arc/MetJ-type ribon-helix-helix transcriptional regulator